MHEASLYLEHSLTIRHRPEEKAELCVIATELAIDCGQIRVGGELRIVEAAELEPPGDATHFTRDQALAIGRDMAGAN